MAQSNPFEHLNLIEYACQEIMVSFAVNNRAGISEFSPAISVIINGGNNDVHKAYNNRDWFDKTH